MEAKDRIKRAAWKLFYQTGYTKASYSLIANASECGRPLVQYHYPKKDELLIEFILQAMELINLEISNDSDGTDNIQQTLQFGQIYYSLLLGSDKMRALAEEILSNRYITSRVIRANAEETVPRILQGQTNEQAIQNSIMATGAVYDLLFEKLQNDEALNPEEFALQNVALFLAINSDYSYSQTMESLHNKLLDAKKALNISTKIINELCE